MAGACPKPGRTSGGSVKSDRRGACLTIDPPAHFAAVALQGGFDQIAAGDARNQFDHVFADALVFTASGIAEADDFHRFFLLEYNVLAAISGGFNPFRPHHQRGRLRAASGEEDEGDEAFHARSLAGFG